MMTQEETMKVIAEGVAPEQICPMIDEISRQVAAGFEIAAECSFVNGEDEIIFDLIMRLLANGMFMEAVDVLTLALSLVTEEKLLSLFANQSKICYYFFNCGEVKQKLKQTVSAENRLQLANSLSASRSSPITINEPWK